MRNSSAPLVSVIIPVHNSDRFLKKTANGILRQTYKNLELLLIPNACTDNSEEICRQLMASDKRVKVFRCNEAGTSLARKCGVLHSQGDWIIFSDHDDRYSSKSAIEDMMRIVEANADIANIVQFGSYTQHLPFLKIKHAVSKSRCIARDELYKREIAGPLVGRLSSLTICVWNKVYEGELLRSAVENISTGLFFAEDVYLNTYAFLSDKFIGVYESDSAHYIWNSGIGFSSSCKAGERLLRDYEVLKPQMVNMMAEKGIPDEIILRVHSEALWCFRAVVNDMIRNGCEEAEILRLIEVTQAQDFVLAARAFFLDHPSYQDQIAPFMVEDSTARAYLAECVKNLPQQSYKQKFSHALGQAHRKITGAN